MATKKKKIHVTTVTRTHTHTHRRWCGWLKRQQQLLPDNPYVSRDGNGGKERGRGEAEGDKLVYLSWGIEGGWWCMIKRKQSCHHFWKVGENNSPSRPLLPPPFPHSFPFSTSITVWRTDKRMIWESQRGKRKEGETLLQVRSTVGSAVQINSLP